MGADQSMGEFPNNAEWFTLAEFADIIEFRSEEKMKQAVLMNEKWPEICTFHGFTPIGIASMHSKGTWAIDKFGTEDRVNHCPNTNLKELAKELMLNVDEDILSEKGFTPIALAVMFGPKDSVRVLIDKGAKTGFFTERGTFSLKDFALFRDDEGIINILKEEEAKYHSQCRHCDTSKCTIS